MADFEHQEREREEVFSKQVKAGKRSYFFDVKSTLKANDLYIVITESKKKRMNDGREFYEKHKIFLYKEDFDKYLDGLTEAVQFVKNNQPELAAAANEQQPVAVESNSSSSYSDISFDDLGS